MKCFITNRECKYDGPAGRRKVEARAPETPAFMVSPFGFPYDDLYRLGITATFRELKMTIARADQSLQLGYVMCQRICRKILDSEFVIADLTEPNGNVYYELGLGYGVGSSIVLLCNERSKNSYTESFEAAKVDILRYRGLESLRDAGQFRSRMNHPFRLSDKTLEHLRINAPHVVQARSPVILNVVNEECPAWDFHEFAAKKAISEYNQSARERPPLEDWKVNTFVVRKNMKIAEAVDHVASARICLFDTTHYGDAPNAHIFFLLGIAHATGREVIPIINRPMNRNVPFDIRGLWQINFERAVELESELAQILPTIDADFKKEKGDYLYRRVWDPFVGQKEIRVITCAREALSSLDRGRRTNVDLWDFNSVKDLSFFIAQKYETAKAPIERPKNKKRPAELAAMNLADYHQGLRQELAGHDCVIIGSPDVSDYAEVALADLHGIEPHRACEDRTQLPYRFIKSTQSPEHPRRNSAFYMIPTRNGEDGVEFGCTPTRLDCGEMRSDKAKKQIYKGQACVVITIAKNPYNRNAADPATHHIMILSGFTGVATYAAVQLLTSIRYRSELEKCFDKYESLGKGKNEPMSGVNILVTVSYTVEGGQDCGGDARELTSVEFTDLELIACACGVRGETPPTPSA